MDGTPNSAVAPSSAWPDRGGNLSAGRPARKSQGKVPLRAAAKSAYAVLNRALHRAGWKLIRRERPTRTFLEFFEHVKRHGFAPRTVIDVGAASGTLDLHVAFPQAHFILIEPLAEFQSALEELKRHYRCDLVAAAAGREKGTAELVLHESPYGNFINRADADLANRAVRPIPITTLDAVIAQSGAAGPMLLKLDIQGHEIEALSGCSDANLAKCEICVIETGLVTRSGPVPSFHDMVDYMKRRGFSVHDILDGLLRPSDGSLGFVDLAFVRDDSPLRVLRPWGDDPRSPMP